MPRLRTVLSVLIDVLSAIAFAGVFAALGALGAGFWFN